MPLTAAMILSVTVLGVIFVVPPVLLLLATKTAALPQASCGKISTDPMTGSLADSDQGTLTCFDAAARACKAASIGVRVMSTDTWTDYVFTVESGVTPCHVSELSQFTLYTGDEHHGGISSGGCLLTAVTRRDVMLACAGQQVLIPASAGEPVSIG
jgi:hypothetical protein